MKVLLHIGSNKTGTSSLQLIFSRSREYLGTQGVLYPYAPASEPTHATLLAGLYHPEFRPRVDPVEKPKSLKQRADFIGNLERTLRIQKPETVVLSSEAFFRPLAAGALEKLQRELLGLGVSEIQVVAYLRRPSHKYLSSLQQKLKASYRLLEPTFPNYKAVLVPYQQVFGKSQVKVRCFDSTTLQGGDVVTDFLSHYLSNSQIESSRLAALGRSNETMSAESMDIIRQYRYDFYQREDNQFKLSSTRLLQQLIALEKSLGLGRPKLKAEIADAVDYASLDALWLRDDLGVIFPNYDYERVESGRLIANPPSVVNQGLSALVEIDRTRQLALIDALRTSRWTTGIAWRDLPHRWRYRLPSRAQWVSQLSRSLTA